MKIRKFLLSAIVFSMSTLAFGKVNINTANVDELAALNGIGEAKAKAIIEYREEHGDFASVDDLSSVKGIGEKIIAKIRDDVTLEGETDLSDISK